MIKLDKIYTRGGDAGKTSLGDGQRVSKNSLRLKAYGEIDELNSCIGVSMLFCCDNLKSILKRIQNQLFDIGADLCKPYNSENANSFANQTNFLEIELD